jgi:type I restriction-modification system DNA methylase subunit
MLFLKRSSDAFEAERERIVGRKVEQGMVRQAAEAQYGEDPDFCDNFFVPERARWSHLTARLEKADEPYGSLEPSGLHPGDAAEPDRRLAQRKQAWRARRSGAVR